jgi:SAM-dependent methyltransferase
MSLDLSYFQRVNPPVSPAELPAHQEYTRYHRKRFAVSREMLEPILFSDCETLSLGLEPGYFEAYLACEHGCCMTGTELPKHLPTGSQYEVAFQDPAHGKTVWIPVIVNDAGKDRLPFADSSFDLVLFLEVIEHFMCRPDFAMSELYRVTRPGGHLLLTTPNAQHWHRIAYLLEGRRYPNTDFRDGDPSSRHHQLFSMKELTGLLQGAGFSVVTARYEDAYNLTNGQSLRDFHLLKSLTDLPEFQKQNIFILARRN